MKPQKGIVFVRSTSIIADSRVLKQADTALKNGFKVYILGWDREKKYIKNKTLTLNNGTIKLKLFHVKSGYGDGLKNISKLLMFLCWILVQLLFIKKKYSFIHSCDFDTVLPCLLVGKTFRKKIVYDIFDYYIHSHNVPSLIEAVVEKTELFVINKADAVIICTESRYKQIEKSNPKRVEVIHNTPNLEMLKKQKLNNICKSSSDKLKVVYVGILQDRRLLKEITELLPEHQNIELHIGGFGINEEFFESIECKNLFYYGQLSYDQVLQLESECDVLFATYDPKVKNHKFSAPNKLYEAMALKKPIIVCKNTGVDEIVSSYNIGLAIEYNATEFYKALLYLSNSHIRKEMGEKGRKVYDEYFSWINMDKKLSKLYSEI